VGAGRAGLGDPAARDQLRGRTRRPQTGSTRRLEAALAGTGCARVALATDRRTPWREINSEGDGLPGLTVDRYGRDVVLQIATAGMAARAQESWSAFFSARTPGRLFVVVPAQAAEREGFTLTQQLHGDDDAARVPRARAGSSACRLRQRRRPGAYLDQRDNRRTIAELARVSGGRMLDVGCHVGGFAIHAAALGVDAVGLDQSAKALDCARENAARNGLAERCAWVQGDMFAALEEPRLAGTFGVLVFDPPRIASSARDVERAAGAMTASLGRLLPRVQAGGFAVVCSCSQHLGGEVLDAVMLDAHAGSVDAGAGAGSGARPPGVAAARGGLVLACARVSTALSCAGGLGLLRLASADRGAGPRGHDMVDDGDAVNAVLGLHVEQLALLGGEDPSHRGGDHAAPVGVAEDDHPAADDWLRDQEALVRLADRGRHRGFTVAANLGCEDRKHDSITLSPAKKNATANFGRCCPHARSSLDLR
jgi:23S rRNA (cytosine1962-C5)-methyltransferase